MQHLLYWQKKPIRRRYYNYGIRINIYCWEYLWISTYLPGTGKPKIKRNEPDYPVTATKKVKRVIQPYKISISYKYGNARKNVRHFKTERNKMEIRARP